MSDRETDAIDEELTAYLDGELPPSESNALERRLVEDEFLRTRLAELRKAYDLLDELPETPHSKSFTQTTIEMVIADVKRSGDQTAIKPSVAGVDSVSKFRISQWFTWPYSLVPLFASILLGSIFGYVISVLSARRELGALDLASSLPGLYDAGELRVLEELAKDKELIGYLQVHYQDALIPVLPKSFTERQIWVRGLNSVQMAKLDNAREMLSKYPSEVRQRLGAVQEQINSQVASEQLNLTARIIGAVLDTMPTSKRQVLEELNTAAKIGFIREQLAFRAAMFYASDLQGADTEAVENWSNGMLLPSIMASIPFLRRETDAKSALMALYSARPVEEGYRLENQDALVSDLAGRLSAFPKSLLETVDASDQLLVISTWMIPEGMNSNARMLEAYDRLRREVRDEIDMADPKDFRRLLRERSRRNGVVRPSR
ncbi:MAG: anti-sigma factor family protein [Pirellula sp.]